MGANGGHTIFDVLVWKRAHVKKVAEKGTEPYYDTTN
jgi:hypothetical protein